VPSGACLYGFCAWPSAQGTACRSVFMPCWSVKHVVSCRPMAHQTNNSSFSSIFSPNAEIFHHFYQLFIIFTNITINSIYIQDITTLIVHVYQTTTGSTVGMACACVLCHVPRWRPRHGMVRRARLAQAWWPPCRIMLGSGQITGPWARPSGRKPHSHV